MSKTLIRRLFLLAPASLVLAACQGEIKADPLIINKIAEFSGDYSELFASDGFGNGTPFNVEWSAKDAKVEDGTLHLSIHKNAEGRDFPYTGGEYRSKSFYGYGDYAVSMKPAKVVGTASTFFLYTGEWDSESLHPSTGENDTRNPDNEEGVHDEIDIEFLGKDTTKVQFNYFTKGKGGHEFMYNLGFDASLEYHTYGFRWEEKAITWFVDDKPVYQATRDLPSHPGRIISNYWCGDKEARMWMGRFEDDYSGEASYQWVSATGEAKSTSKKANPEPTSSTEEEPAVQNWDEIDPIDLTLLDKNDQYNVNVASDKKSAEVTYTSVGKQSYINFSLDVPSDKRNSNAVYLELENKGTSASEIRIDVNASESHGENNITAINTKATFDGVEVYTDTSWGGSKFNLEAGKKGVAIIEYDGTPINLMFMADSAIFNDTLDTHAGDILISNVKFRASEGAEESSTPSEEANWDAIEDADFVLLDKSDEYTVDIASDKKSATVSYTSVAENSYRNVNFSVPSTKGTIGEIRFEVENKGENPVSVRTDVNASEKHGENNINAINTKATVDGRTIDTDLSWGGSKFNLAAGKKSVVVITIDGNPVNLMFMLDSSIGNDTLDTHAGTLTFNGLKVRVK